MKDFIEFYNEQAKMLGCPPIKPPDLSHFPVVSENRDLSEAEKLLLKENKKLLKENLQLKVRHKELSLEAPPEITAHIVCEDRRYPMLCINGKFNYGLFIDPDTGEIDNRRVCICAARADDYCICDLD